MVSSDQFGEETYIRYGKSKGGLVGISLAQEQVTSWILSHHICSQLSLSLEKLFDEDDVDVDIAASRLASHKEEGANRRKLDFEDRVKIREKLKIHTNPLQRESATKLSLLPMDEWLIQKSMLRMLLL